MSAVQETTARVHNQNDRVIAACEHELRKRDLSEESQSELIKTMSNAAALTANESAASRDFMRSQLDHSHKQPWKIFVWRLLVGFGGAIYLKGAV